MVNNHNHPSSNCYKRLSIRVSKPTYLHLKKLQANQQNSLKQVITDLINSQYHMQPQIKPMSDVTRQQILQRFLTIQKLVDIINSVVQHDSNNLNQIAFKVNVHDFKNKHPEYITNNKDNLIRAINCDKDILHGAQSAFNSINREMYHIWQSLI